MRMRWRYYNGRYELTVQGMKGNKLVVVAQVWRSIVSGRWSATVGPLEAQTFDKKEAAYAWVEEMINTEVMSIHERRR